jgi:hypothetical protein
MIPTSLVYYMLNGKLTSSPRFGGGIINEEEKEISLPGNYALLYTEKPGSIQSKDIIIKVFLIKNGNHEIKEFRSNKYGNNPKILKESVEQYMKYELSDPQQTLAQSRKKRNIKSKVKRYKK